MKYKLVTLASNQEIPDSPHIKRQFIATFHEFSQRKLDTNVDTFHKR